MKTYRMRLSARDIIFRELNLGEWGDLGDFKTGNLTLYAKVVECALLQPSYADLRPGEILFLGEQIFQLSSKFSDDKEIEDRVSDIQKTLKDSIHIVPALICAAFPAYTPEMVLAFDFDTLMIRLAQAQWLNSQNEPSAPPEGADDLQMKSIDHNKGALTRALREAKQKGAPNVTRPGVVDPQVH